MFSRIRRLIRGPFEAFKRTKSNRTFPGAVEAFQRHSGQWVAYYDGSVGSLDVMDAEKNPHTIVYARNLNSGFAVDLVKASAYVTVILNDPTEAQAFRWCCDGVNVAAILKRDNQWGRIDDLTKAPKKAREKVGAGPVGTVRIFVFESLSSEGKNDDVRSVGGTVLRSGYIPAPGTLPYYVLRSN